ncbi:MAG: transglutaminase-like domain-containing protein [Bacteroidia bacterium]|nr:transglutaminase-like domain-containing protein [Bacteroidia bacterium]
MDFNALIYLIDDPDKTVREEVTNKILQLGDTILPSLKQSLENLPFDSPEGIERLNNLIREIELSKVSDNIVQWASSPEDLLKGIWLTNLTSGSDIDFNELNKEIERIKLEVWLDLRNDLTALEKVNILNHVFFKRFNFKGDNSDYHNPDNSFLNRVIKKKKGNPISLAILYSIVAQRLFIPIYGVNLPQHFILAYLDIPDLPSPNADSKGLMIDAPQGYDVLFYINPFNEGSVFGKKHVEIFLQQINIDNVAPEQFYPCSNRDIVIRVLRNLYNSYAMRNQEFRVKQYEKLLNLLNA